MYFIIIAIIPCAMSNYNKNIRAQSTLNIFYETRQGHIKRHSKVPATQKRPRAQVLAYRISSRVFVTTIWSLLLNRNKLFPDHERYWQHVCKLIVSKTNCIYNMLVNFTMTQQQYVQLLNKQNENTILVEIFRSYDYKIILLLPIRHGNDIVFNYLCISLEIPDQVLHQH